DAECALVHSNALELLVATILSAQCTDVRVNLVTKELFKRYKSAKDFAESDPKELEAAVRSTGFFRNKAKSIHGASERLVAEFSGEVPRSMEQLLTLPGVARKTASVVLGVSYGLAEGVVVDTHVYRVSRRLGLSRAAKVGQVEQDLMRILPHEDWIDYSHLVIFHGRRICQARKPKCPECPLADLCPSATYFLNGKIPPWERSAEAAPSPREPARTRAAMAVRANTAAGVRQSKKRTKPAKRSASRTRAAAASSKNRPAKSRPRRGRG
ncbi:MAG TPA: endonuclease III, partial [Candidatus Eisenbacteria bacterium]|nr:endonuclease III [Candidatus Eisenbacteria bacterium]